MRATALLATGVAALAVVPVGAGVAAKPKQPKPRFVNVGDDYFAPAAIKVPLGTRVVWKWLSVNGETHDVKLQHGPKGVKRFHSDPAAADFSFKRTLKVKGQYAVICTFHEDMKMTITVK